MKDVRFEKLKKVISDEKKGFLELEKAYGDLDKASAEDAPLINSQIQVLEKNIKTLNSELKEALSLILFSKPLEIQKKSLKKTGLTVPKKELGILQDTKLKSDGGKVYSKKEVAPIGLEKETIKEIKKKKEEEKRKKENEKKDASYYSKIASQYFSQYSRKLLGKKTFQDLEDNLIKANLNYTPVGYISVIILTTLISIFAAGFIFLFFMFFNLGAALPIITRATDPINLRFLKVFWVLFVVPLGTFFFMYAYPSLEKSSTEQAIDVELPFATINMAAISGSMINPDRIFEIIIETKEYPALSKEFTKMINEINLYGYDLVSAMKDTAKNNASKKLSELLNGLSTDIQSGGDLGKFFNERAESLLFDYKLERERSAKAAETFMDLYISLVIAAPMILMLLLMIMRIANLGMSLSVGTISLLVIMGVVVINIIFMAFLHVKKN